MIDDMFLSQQAFLYFKSNFTSDFWIGLRKMDNNIWAWTDGTELEYPNWGYDEPKPDMNCGAMAFAGGKWSAQNCSTVKPFVCSLKAENLNLGN
uniref:C-type lectin domain-containing protein n=1 Tax=Panagrolaimus davidi TaxID=227884 RepID=A0A914QSU2_9BILA